MFTHCPECGTVFRISPLDLRQAEGMVRCGHCSATFNALLTLTDEPPPTEQPERRGGPRALPGFPEEPPEAAPTGAPLAADAPLPEDVPEDTLEFDLPEDRWTNFFGEAPRATPTFPVDTENSPLEVIDDNTSEQAVVVQAAVETPDEEDEDWGALLEELTPDEEAEPVYVIGQAPDPIAAGTPIESPDSPETWLATIEEQPLAAQEPAPEPEPTAEAWRDSPDFTDTGAFASVKALRDPWEDLPLRVDPPAAASAAEQPFVWEPPGGRGDPTPGHWGWTAGSVMLALLLLIQALHLRRDELATWPSLTEPLKQVYATLNWPLYPSWDLRAYQLRGSEAVAGRLDPAALEIRARITVTGNQPVGLPLVRITLRDRRDQPLASRVLPATEYLPGGAVPREPIAPGTVLPVQALLKDPGADAYGFDVDVCLRTRQHGLSCRAEGEPFAR